MQYIFKKWHTGKENVEIQLQYCYLQNTAHDDTHVVTSSYCTEGMQAPKQELNFSSKYGLRQQPCVSLKRGALKGT